MFHNKDECGIMRSGLLLFHKLPRDRYQVLMDMDNIFQALGAIRAKYPRQIYEVLDEYTEANEVRPLSGR